MFTPDTTPYVKPLGNGLVLRSLATPEDIDRLAIFNRMIFPEEPPVDQQTRTAILHHPHTRPEHWLFIEDEATGQIVSALCLLPSTWRYEEVELKAGEMGIVCTRPEYRRRGLIRALDRRFKELLREGEFDLSPIQGIPYFYRQFGYEYAIPLEGGWRVELHQAPQPDPRYHFRPAESSDIPALKQLYEDAARELSISAVRDDAIWHHLFEHFDSTMFVARIWLVMDHASGQPVGYWSVEKAGFGEGLNVHEVSRLRHTAALAVLAQLKEQAVERNKPYIRLNLPDKSSLVQIARSLGATDQGRYAWQIYLPDIARLCRKLAPVLERRIASSAFAGLTKAVFLNFFRQAVELNFEAGRLVSVNTPAPKDWGEINIPPNLFAPLVFGYRSREELQHMYPDFSSWGEASCLVDVLFPRLDAFIHTTY